MKLVRVVVDNCMGCPYVYHNYTSNVISTCGLLSKAGIGTDGKIDKVVVPKKGIHSKCPLVDYKDVPGLGSRLFTVFFKRDWFLGIGKK